MVVSGRAPTMLGLSPVSLQFALPRLQLLQVLGQQLFAGLQITCCIEVLILDSGSLLLADAGQLFLDLCGVRGQVVLGAGGLGVSISLILRLCLGRLLRLLCLLQLVPLLLDLGQLLSHVLLGEGRGLVKRKLILLGLLLCPPFLKFSQLLQSRLSLVRVHPRHVLLYVHVDLLQVSQGVLDLVYDVWPRLQLQGPLLHGAQQGLELCEPLLVVGPSGPRLPHPLLVLGAELRDLLTLLLCRDLDNVLPVDLVAASVDRGLQVVLHASHGKDVSLLLRDDLELLAELCDPLLLQRHRREVHALHGELLLVLPLLLLHHDLRLALALRAGVGRGVVLLLRVHGRLLLGSLLCAIGALGRVRVVGGLGGVGLGLLLGHVHPVELLHCGYGALDLKEATGLQGDGDRDLGRASHVVLLPFATEGLADASDGVFTDKDAVLEDLDGKVLLQLEGQLLLTT
mmetsp:Transcript_90122/g.263507  ORF Transcript_90122/g.263507 Transcript_90122/m.263507 type:complete len:456 (-) Transcript_90122:1478-2845(-)